MRQNLTLTTCSKTYLTELVPGELDIIMGWSHDLQLCSHFVTKCWLQNFGDVHVFPQYENRKRLFDQFSCNLPHMPPPRVYNHPWSFIALCPRKEAAIFNLSKIKKYKKTP